jgi:hypothetical protein
VSEQLKFLFDENLLGVPGVKDLASIYDKSPERPILRHYLEVFSSGEDDDVWIPVAGKEGYIIISSDRARRSGGAKLPFVCHLNGVVHILVSGKVHSMNNVQKVEAIISVWSEIMSQVSAAAPGTGFLLRLSNSRKPILEKLIPKNTKTSK